MRTSIKSLLLTAMLLAGIIGCTQSVARRPDRKVDDLLAARQVDDAAQAQLSQQVGQKLFKRIEAKAASTQMPKPTLDILVISGGGDWGAFGAGVLKGWGRVKGERARPQFDIVTGVSTGALIAPFAFLGDEDSIERIVQLYRNPYSDIAVSRSTLFFLPNNPSFYVLPGLERQLQKTIDRAMVERLVAQEATGRALLVNTTNIDLGDNRAWDLLAEARRALAQNDMTLLHRIML